MLFFPIFAEPIGGRKKTEEKADGAPNLIFLPVKADSRKSRLDLWANGLRIWGQILAGLPFWPPLSSAQGRGGVELYCSASCWVESHIGHFSSAVWKRGRGRGRGGMKGPGRACPVSPETHPSGQCLQHPGRGEWGLPEGHCVHGRTTQQQEHLHWNKTLSNSLKCSQSAFPTHQL